MTSELDRSRIAFPQAPLSGSPVWRSPVAAFPPEFDDEGNPPLTDGRSVVDTLGVWHVARCRAKHVKAYARDLLTLSKLTDGAVNYLLPMRYGPTAHGGKKRRYKTPLFPGTIFVCIADDSLEIDPNHRTFPQHALKVPASAQQRLRDDLVTVEMLALNDPGTLDVWTGILPGHVVEILDGPYRGLKANVIEFTETGKRQLVVRFKDVQFAATVHLGEHVRVERIE